MIDYNKGVGTAKSANQKAKEKFKKKIDQAACSKQIEEGMAQSAATMDISLKEDKSHTGNKITWDDAIQNFILEKTTLQKCDPITLKGYLTHLRLFRAYMSNVHGFTRLDLASIKRQHIAGFINYTQNDLGRSMNTVNHYITSIKAFYNTLKKGKYIKENPFAEIEKVTVPEKDYASFTDEQIQVLLKQPDRKEWRGIRDYALLTFLAETGCRISEAILLEIKDITFDEEDDMPDFVTFYMTKKKKTLRRVGLSEEASFALHTWLKIRSQMKLKPSWVGDVKRHRSLHYPLKPLEKAEYVFTNEKGQYVSRNTWRNRIKMYCAMADLPEDIAWTSHCLRHSYGKICLENGLDVTTVQETMGHSTLEMVSHYSKSVGKELFNKQKNFSPSAMRKQKRSAIR